MEQTLGEMVDKFAIGIRKARVAGSNSELLDLGNAIAKKIGLEKAEFLFELCQACDVNYAIWDLEKELKSDNEELLYLAEIGRRALRIRDINKERIEVKNNINKLAGENSRDVKVDHASEKKS